jgi:ornithine cyclodeaminase/alanine dehydrogenase-like protein (mu-crystallin family)
MSEAPLWLDEDDVARLISLDEAIEVLAGAYRLQAAGAAASMSRAHLREGDSILHAVGGTIAGAGVAGTKTWLYTPGGATPLLVLFSLEDGRALGVVEAFALGQLRTAGTSGLATRLLAREDASSLALVGTGKQAFAQAKAVASVRPIEEIRVVGRDPGRRAAMAARLRDELDVDVAELGDVATAVDGAAVITTITRSADPVLGGDSVAPGAHVNAVGAIVATRRELEVSAVGRASTVVVDSVAQAREDAGELLAAAETGDLDWTTVRGLDEVVDETPTSLRAPEDVTLFKAVGVGLSDVAIGAEVLRRAHAEGSGRPLSLPALTHH